MKLFAKIAELTNPGRVVGMGVFTWIAVITLLLDQVSKLVVLATLVDRPPVVLLPDMLQLQYRTNTGAAFSLLEGHTVLLTLVSIVISLFLLLWAWRLKPGEQGFRLSFGLILGGAIGNLIDRVRLGQVVDFIDAHWRDVYHWPTFNIADSAICVGIFLLVLASFRPVRAVPAEDVSAPAERTTASR